MSRQPDGKSRPLRPSPSRLVMVFALFAVLFAALAGRLLQLGFEHQADQRLRTAVQQKQAVSRPEIHDRHGRPLALDVPTSSLYADPKFLLGVDETAEKLAEVLPSLDVDELRKKLAANKRFVWLKRHLTPDERKAVHDLGLPGLSFMRENKRFYPLGQLTAHVIGMVDRDNRALSGIERHIDGLIADRSRTISREEMIARPVTLSLDLRVQHVLAFELERAINRYKAKAGAGLVLDMRTGEVLALSSWPGFDPLNRAQALLPERLNRAMRGVYEQGSVLKSFTLAMGLDEGVVSKGERFDVATPIVLGPFKIEDHHKTADGAMSLTEVFTNSSNVGAARIARKVGVERHRAFLSRLQLLSRMDTEAGGTGRVLQPENWQLSDSLSISYGYRLAVSPLQLAASAMALFNGGYLVKPTFLRRSSRALEKPGIPVLKSQTSRFMCHLMRENVRFGTGRGADVPGYRIGGKTGTARKAAKGGYSRELITSFMAIFPAESPRYLTYVMLDAPQKVKASGFGNSAAQNAAPLTGRIIARIAPLMEILALDKTDN